MNTFKHTLPLPAHFNPEIADDLWNVEKFLDVLLRNARTLQKEAGIPDASLTIETQVLLILIDMQTTFCSKRHGSLYVAGRDDNGPVDGGAVSDSIRIARFIYRNLHWLDKILATLDSHHIEQIFLSVFLEDLDGNPLQPNTLITVEDLENGTYRVSPRIAELLGFEYEWLCDYALHYARQLRALGHHAWTNWPMHALIGAAGHILHPIVAESVWWHAFVRRTTPWILEKGDETLTEQYDAATVEVPSAHDGTVVGHDNAELISRVRGSKRVIIAGEAKSHCVGYFLLTLIRIFKETEPEVLTKIYVLEDCMSNVVIRDDTGAVLLDFTSAGDTIIESCRSAGMHIVKSTDPMWEWPDFAA